MNGRNASTLATTSSPPREHRGSVVGRLESEHDARVAARAESRERAVQHRLTHLRGAAAADHFGVGLHRRQRGRRRAAGIEHLEALDEAPVDPVLQREHARPRNAASPPRAECRAVAEIQQHQEVTLRPVGAQRVARDARAQVGGEPRSLPHRIDAGLRKVGFEARAVAGGEERVVRFDLQRRAHAHEAALVRRQRARGKERLARGAGRPDQRVERQALAAVEDQRAVLDGHDARARPQHHAARARRDLDLLRHARRKPRQHARRRVDHSEHRVARAFARTARAQRERELHAARARAAHDHARAVLLPRPRHRRIDRRDEPPDRPRRQRELARAWEVEARHRRADVERGGVVVERRATFELDAPLARDDAGRARHHDGSAGAPRERAHVDLEFLASVVPGDEARHHARIDRDRVVHDERHVRARERSHREVAQHLDVRVSSADENEFVRTRASHSTPTSHQSPRRSRIRAPCRATT